MTFVPLHDSRHISRSDHLSRQIRVARELALNGAAGPARQICGSSFLDNAMMLLRDETLLASYVECLLLLEMTPLLSRVIRAIYGITFNMAPLTTPGPRRWRLAFGNGVTLEVASPGLWADRVMREQAAERLRVSIMAAAGREPVVEMAPSVTGRALEPAN